MKRLVLCLAAVLAGCGGVVQAEPAPVATSSCEASTYSDAAGNTLWTFSARLSGNPLPGACTDLRDGIHFWCAPSACLFLSYTGTCPHCPGGGE